MIYSPITAKPLDRLNLFLNDIFILSHWNFVTTKNQSRCCCSKNINFSKVFLLHKKIKWKYNSNINIFNEHAELIQCMNWIHTLDELNFEKSKKLSVGVVFE